MAPDGTGSARRWFWLATAAAVAVWLGVLARPSGLTWWGVSPLEPRFSDTVAILAAGEAAHAGIDVYAGNPLDPQNRPHVYGPWWLAAGWMGLGRADAWWVGLLLDAVALAVALRLLSPRDLAGAAVTVLLLASPPMLLALERGNNDLVMLILAAAAAWCLGRRAQSAPAAAAGLLVAASALKLYPVVALPALAARATSRRRALLLVACAVAACALLTWLQLAAYRRTLAIAPAPLTLFAHGAGLTVKILRWLAEPRAWILAGMAAAGATLLGLGLPRARAAWRLLPATGTMTAAYVAGALAWIGCYLVTTSFPYRLVLLLLPAACLLRGRSGGAGERAGSGQLAMIVAAFWATCLKGHAFVPAADGRTLTGSPVAWIALGFEQVLLASLAVALGVTVLGWAVRRLQGETA